MRTNQHASGVVILYHGTTPEDADNLLEQGWAPNRGHAGGNAGQTRYLYLTNILENALWFSEQKGCACVLEVEVSLDALIVDPEDGIADSVEAELCLPHGLPGSVALTQPLQAAGFRQISLDVLPRPGFR